LPTRFTTQLFSAANVADCLRQTFDKVWHPAILLFKKIRRALLRDSISQYLGTTPHQNLFWKGQFHSCSANGGSTKLSVTDSYQREAMMQLFTTYDDISPSGRLPMGPDIPNQEVRRGPIAKGNWTASLHFIDRFVPAFLAFIDDRVIPATHRGADRLDCHDPRRLAVGTILQPYGLRPVRQLGRCNFTHDWPLGLMREREVSQSSVDAVATEYPLFEVPALIRIKIKAGSAKKQIRPPGVETGQYPIRYWSRTGGPAMPLPLISRRGARALDGRDRKKVLDAKTFSIRALAITKVLQPGVKKISALVPFEQ
jgi:hypothetical protein